MSIRNSKMRFLLGLSLALIAILSISYFIRTTREQVFRVFDSGNCYLYWSKAPAEEPFITTITTPSSATTKTGQGDQMNANWRQILTYLQQNPQNSGPFLLYLQNTFFKENGCSVQAIDFSTLADTYTPVFS